MDDDRAAQYGAGLQIDLGDKTGFLQALSDIEDGPLDVLIHSPGGSPFAAESIVKLLRSRFQPIRFVVPHTAKSAATMLALSGNEILLGEAAELGPIDPQLRVMIDQRPITVPADAAIAQFAAIHKDVTTNPDSMRGWPPILRQYGPSFLQECMNAINLSEQLVADWLKCYMLKGEKNAEQRAKNIAKWLATHDNFKSHSRPIWLDQLKGSVASLAKGRCVIRGLPVHLMILRWPDGPVAMPWPRSGRTVRDRRRARRSGPRRQCRPGGRTSRPGPCAARASPRSP